MSTPALLLVAHGTGSAQGSATTARLRAAVATARPQVPVHLAFLDVAEPRLPEVLARCPGPAVLVPALLSTGYHVQADIPAAVAGRGDVHLARHLGPHPLLVDALADRLAGAGAGDAPATVLVASGSSRPEAAAEIAETARLLGERLHSTVTVATLGEDLTARFAALPTGFAVATYLLAEGQFVQTLRAAAAGRGTVADPIGVHPALVALIWQRYDAAR